MERALYGRCRGSCTCIIISPLHIKVSCCSQEVGWASYYRFMWSSDIMIYGQLHLIVHLIIVQQKVVTTLQQPSSQVATGL